MDPLLVRFYKKQRSFIRRKGKKGGEAGYVRSLVDIAMANPGLIDELMVHEKQD